MIEIFYPKEMRQAIEELRAKDDLNEKVLKRLNIVFYITLFFVMISIVWFFKELYWPNKGYQAPAMISTISIIYILCYWNGVWKTGLASYLFGIVTIGTVDKVWFAPNGGVFITTINSITNERHNVIGKYPLSLFKSYELPKIGQKLEYYYAEKTPYKPTPKIKILMEEQCLKKSLIENYKKISE